MKIRVGIIGMGKMGMMHSAILNSIDAVEVTSICDTSRFFNYLVSKADFPGKVFSDYKELISSDDVDVVFITTPVFLHYPMIIECIEKGKHFFVEKPLCLNKEETDAISNKLQKTNLKSMIGYVYNFKPTYSKLKSIINNKELGDVSSFKSFSYKSSVKSRTNNWRFNKNLSGGGVVTSFGSHMLSIIFDIFGNPKETYIEKESYFNDDIEDFAKISLVYNRGIKGEFLTDWSKGNYRKEDNRISIKCSNGEISADNYQIYINKEKIIPIQELWRGSHLDIGGSHYSIQNLAFINSIINDKISYDTTCEYGVSIQKIINEVYKN